MQAVATGAVTEGTWINGVLQAAKVLATDGSAFYGKFDAKGRPTGAAAYSFAARVVAADAAAAERMSHLLDEF